MIRVVHPGSRIRMLTFYPFRIPDPGVKKAPDPGSATLILMFVLLCAEGGGLPFLVELTPEGGDSRAVRLQMSVTGTCTGMEFLNTILAEFSALIFPFYKMLFMNSLEFSCFADFSVCTFKNQRRVPYGFL
jgi:hypothetical protein